MDPEKWLDARRYKPEHLEAAKKMLEEVRRGKEVWQVTRHYPLKGGGYLPKHILVAVYHQLVESGEWAADENLLTHIRMKPVRTLSGVTTVTVLTKSYPCPGHCIFCPTEERMPKSYLSDEPGARRGLQHGFDPFEQVHSRLTALEAVGHPTDKIELLILGGTFSAYRRDYQEWFVKRCFDAMNMEELPDLEAAQQFNENTVHRNVGLVIETRPDEINPRELAWLRRLGVTKVQMGAQSLDDRILALNKRGHTAADTLRACALLRAWGFKIVLHWMPNLLGATLESDRADFARFWEEAGDGSDDSLAESGFCPDEIKIYPCQLLENAELYQYWQRGEFVPYSERDLVNLVADVKPGIPRYCRVNRVVRDIPSTHVVAGSKRTSLRQDVQEELARRGTRCQCLRCREVRGQAVALSDLRLEVQVYHPANTQEHFLSFVTPDDQVAGYLRLSLPEGGNLAKVVSAEEGSGRQPSQGTGENVGENLAKVVSAEEGSGRQPSQGGEERQASQGVGGRQPSQDGGGVGTEALELEKLGMADLAGAAIIREVHVYGQSLQVGEEKAGAAQHAGLGTRLIAAAEKIARQQGYRRMAVIAAVGTRQYYRGRGFVMGNLYMVKELVD